MQKPVLRSYVKSFRKRFQIHLLNIPLVAGDDLTPEIFTEEIRGKKRLISGHV